VAVARADRSVADVWADLGGPAETERVTVAELHGTAP
jgi:hypothetical protein